MKDLIVDPYITVKGALKKLNISAKKVLFVLDEAGKLLGAISDGDIRRYILSNGDISGTIKGVYNESPFYLVENEYSAESLKSIMIKEAIEVLPIVDTNHLFKKYHTWDEVFAEDKNFNLRRDDALSDIPIVIMAGGKGTRLKPFTDVLPKPLVPVKDKPIMDWIIDEFKQYGAQEYYATLNYRGKMIEAYYSSIDKDYDISFKWEKDFYGTAGSLILLNEELKGTFIVSNCDIIVRVDYDRVLDFHRESGAAMTIVSSIQHHVIPYGVLEFEDGGVVTNIIEKPEYTHVVNTGVYILEKECLDFIPAGEFFHITHLMEKLIENGKKVVTFPAKEKDYIDIGQWEEYLNSMGNFKF